MKLLIISGLSGSGKSVALHTLEDIGFYCIDNLPMGLLATFARHLMEESGEHPPERVAIGIDARNHPDQLQRIGTILGELREQGIECQIIFLQADEATLLKRFSETRRKHPLTGKDISLADAIARERELLNPIAQNANLFIDTSHTNVHQLRDLIQERVGSGENRDLSLLFESFGFKHGIPGDADFVFDARCLPNPHWDPNLRPLTGRDQAVANFLDQHELAMTMYEQIRDFLHFWLPHFKADKRSYLTVAIGCTGGQHRSVYLTERLAAWFRERHQNVALRHRELP
jgi:RNase adapter protein RapZ